MNSNNIMDNYYIPSGITNFKCLCYISINYLDYFPHTIYRIILQITKISYKIDKLPSNTIYIGLYHYGDINLDNLSLNIKMIELGFKNYTKILKYLYNYEKSLIYVAKLCYADERDLEIANVFIYDKKYNCIEQLSLYDYIYSYYKTYIGDDNFICC